MNAYIQKHISLKQPSYIAFKVNFSENYATDIPLSVRIHRDLLVMKLYIRFITLSFSFLPVIVLNALVNSMNRQLAKLYECNSGNQDDE